MSHLRRPWTLVTALVVAAVALVGCGSSESTSSSQSAASGQSSTVPDVIRIANDQVVTSLDPNVFASYEFTLVTFLWGGFLTTYGPGEPFLAGKVSSSDDFKVWTVTLRPGVKFSDGTPVAARDVVATFERLDKRRGIETDLFIGTFFDQFTSVTAADESTAIFRFRDPYPDFAKQVSMPEFVIVPASGLARGESFWKHPISAGRYQVEKADVANGTFSFTANPNYPGRHPQVKRVEVTAVPDAATRLAQLKSGQLDYAVNMPGNLLPQITGELRVDPAPWNGGALFLGPNTGKGSDLADPRIRQAIHLALDRKQISETALGGEVAGKPLYGIPWNTTNEPPNVPAFDPDLEKAKELLEGTACENGCTIQTEYYTDAVWQLPVAIQVVAQQLREIGIDLKLDGISVAKGSTLKQNGWELAMEWTGNYVDSPTYLSNYYIGGSWFAPHGFSSPKMRALAKRMAVADPKDLGPMIEEANQLYAEENPPFIPLTTLTYLGASTLPADVITNHGAAYIDIK